MINHRQKLTAEEMGRITHSGDRLRTAAFRIPKEAEEGMGFLKWEQEGIQPGQGQLWGPGFREADSGACRVCAVGLSERTCKALRVGLGSGRS